MTMKIVVATHKKYWMPNDQLYLPLHVGAEGKFDCLNQSLDIGYVKDNTGDNISYKNANYCELTGLYWTWKNLKFDYIGLAHYRRHFSNGKLLCNKKNKVITEDELRKVITESKGIDIFLPKPRNYWIETNYSQYAHAHHSVDLDTTREIIQERHPNYIKAFDESMSRTVGHRFNMFIMKKDKFDEYCTWLFDILFELEKRLDINGYNKNDSRVFGFVSERLIDPWIETNGYRYRTMPYVFMENQNWMVKGASFLKRKIMGEKRFDKQ